MSQPRAAAGVGLVLLGTVFLLDALAVLDLWAAGGGWWPLLLVVCGVVLLLRRAPVSKPSRSGSLFAVLSARTAEVSRRPYQGGRAVAVLGHAGLDFRSTAIEEDAQLRVVALLGDLDDDLLPAAADAPVLSVTGVVLLSGLRVRTGSIVG